MCSCCLDIELGLQKWLTFIASTEFKRSYVSNPRSSIWYEVFREGGGNRSQLPPNWWSSLSNLSAPLLLLCEMGITAVWLWGAKVKLVTFQKAHILCSWAIYRCPLESRTSHLRCKKKKKIVCSNWNSNPPFEMIKNVKRIHWMSPF